MIYAITLIVCLWFRNTSLKCLCETKELNHELSCSHCGHFPESGRQHEERKSACSRDKKPQRFFVFNENCGDMKSVEQPALADPVHCTWLPKLKLQSG